MPASLSEGIAERSLKRRSEVMWIPGMAVRPGEGDLHHDERSSNALADGYKVRGLPSGTQRTRIQGIASASVLCIMPAWSEPRIQWASSL